MASYTAHTPDESLLEPFRYINQIPGKDIRGRLIDCFQKWLRIPEDKIATIKEIITELHNASLLVDDIEDGSHLRRGIPVAHAIYGVPTTINTANYVYFMALERCHMLGSPKAMNVFVSELLNLHRGQGQDIMWRDALNCPTEEEYTAMVVDKTGGLFRLAVGLMHAFSIQDDGSEGKEGGGVSAAAASSPAPASSSSSSSSNGGGGVGDGEKGSAESEESVSSFSRVDFIPLVNKLALYFQIRDDLVNLASVEYHTSKSFCEDLTEGKFSFPIIHAIRTCPSDHQLLNILKQRTESKDVKKYAVEHMERCGSFAYTRMTLERLREEVGAEIAKLGGHLELEVLLTYLHKQVVETDGRAAHGKGGGGGGGGGGEGGGSSAAASSGGGGGEKSPAPSSFNQDRGSGRSSRNTTAGDAPPPSPSSSSSSSSSPNHPAMLPLIPPDTFPRIDSI